MSSTAGPSLKELIVGVDHAMPAAEAPGMFTIRLQGETKLVAATELARLRGELRGALSGGYRRIAARIAGGKAGHEDMDAIRKDQYIVSRVSDTLGGASFPPLTIWDRPEALLNQGQAALKGNDLSSAAGTLEPADVESARADRQFIEYREGTISGASRAVTGLEVTRDVSFLTAGIIATVATGGAAGAVIGAGITGVGTAAQQGMELHLGMRDKIDWAGITFDALIGIVTAKLGGKLGNSVASGLMKNPTFAKYGGKLVAIVVSDLIAGKATVILHSTARFVFDKMRGANENVTVEDFLHELATSLTDPKALLHDLLLGELARRIHGSAGNLNRSSSSKSGSGGGESKPPKGGKAPTDPPATKAGAESRTNSAPAEPQPQTAPKPASQPVPAEQVAPKTAPVEPATAPKPASPERTATKPTAKSSAPVEREPAPPKRAASKRQETETLEPEPRSRPKKASKSKAEKRREARRADQELAAKGRADREVEAEASRNDRNQKTGSRQREEGIDAERNKVKYPRAKDQANAAKRVRKILDESAEGKQTSLSPKRKDAIMRRADREARIAEGQTAKLPRARTATPEAEATQTSATTAKAKPKSAASNKKGPVSAKAKQTKQNAAAKTGTPGKKPATAKKGAKPKAATPAKKPAKAKQAATAKKAKAPAGSKKAGKRKGAKQKRPVPDKTTADRNRMLGELGENLTSSQRARAMAGLQKSYWRGKPMLEFELTNKRARQGTSRPDEVRVRVPKSGPPRIANVEIKANNLRDLTPGEATSLAKEHLGQVQGKVANVLPGSSFEMSYTNMPPKAVRDAMAAQLLSGNSPILVVRFGGSAVYTKSGPP